MSDSKVIGKPTPGPWKIGANGSGGGIGIDAVDPKDGLNFEVCEVWGTDRDNQIDAAAEANANLICASPDLLEALEYLMRIVDSSGDERYVQIQLTPEFFEPARAAITRARGLSQ